MLPETIEHLVNVIIKNPESSIDELSDESELTQSAIREALRSLEAQGRIKSEVVPDKTGRNIRCYTSTGDKYKVIHDFYYK